MVCRLLSLLTAWALSAIAAAAPVGAQSAPSTEHIDRSVMLAGRWTCRTAFGARTRHVGTLAGATLDIRNDVQPAGGGAYRLDDVYRYDDVSDQWYATFGAGSPFAVDAVGPRWTQTDWELRGYDRAGRAALVRFEALPDGTLRRTFLRSARQRPDRWSAYSAELCAAGDDGPPAGACIVPDMPANTIFGAPVDMRDVPLQAPRGTVQVVVTLDADSQIVSTAVASAPSVYLIPPALRAARASRFHTVIRDCRPEAGRYIFSVVFGA